MMPTLYRLLLTAFLAVFLVAAAPAAYAQLNEIPSPQTPSNKEEVELYQHLQGKITGDVTIPDRKLATLVQPEGREWREFRNYWYRIISGVMIVGMLAGGAPLFPFPGPNPLPAGRGGGGGGPVHASRTLPPLLGGAPLL